MLVAGRSNISWQDCSILKPALRMQHAIPCTYLSVSAWVNEPNQHPTEQSVYYVRMLLIRVCALYQHQLGF
jgi:hypothetical protein